MKRYGFTLVEMIMVIVIMGILSAGTFVSLKHLYQRVAKSKALSELSFDSQIVVDQVSALIYDRVPNSVYGYDVSLNKKSIYEIVGSDYKIVEWTGLASESLKRGDYSGFVDMDASDGNKTIKTYDIDKTKMLEILQKKFNKNSLNDFGLVFAGSFDGGADLNVSTIEEIKTDSIVLNDKPNEIYEKYYLLDGAYAIARKEDINFTCNVLSGDSNVTNTLFLFYNYRPWKNETFCSSTTSVTILTKEAKAFEIGLINDSIYFNLTLSRKINGIDKNITISKQKVVF